MTLESLAPTVNALLTSSIFYFMAINSLYMLLLLAAVYAIRKNKKLQPVLSDMQRRFAVLAPPVTVIAPAYNEEETILDSVKSFLSFNYPSTEIIVVNDGSKDSTLAKLISEYSLEETSLIYDPTLSATKIRGTYRSRIHPNLVVVDKENGGKADALNVGIEFASSEIFCAVDSDSLIEEDALLKVVLPFIEHPKEMIAVGGTVRVANGSEVRFGRVTKPGLSMNPLCLMQVVEYTRAFLCGRVGWNHLNCTLVISGAFGLFRRDTVIEAGGYKEGSLGEDMELIVRLHKAARRRGSPYRIEFLPDPVCWTQAPSDFKTLYRQRHRWQRGLAGTLLMNYDMLFNPKYGALGILALPYFVFVELLGPVIELAALVLLIVAGLCGILETETFILSVLAGVLYGVILSISSVLIEAVHYPKYPKTRQFLALLAVTLGESFGYRQLTAVWRLMGLFSYARGDRAWGKMKRASFNG